MFNLFVFMLDILTDVIKKVIDTFNILTDIITILIDMLNIMSIC